MSKLEPFTSGYMKPPKHSQFKKGKSGNPKGRPRKPDDVPTMIERVMKRKVRVEGEDKKITMMNALMRKLREQVLTGDMRAFSLTQRVLETDAKLSPARSYVQMEATDAKLRLAEMLGLIIGPDNCARTPEEHEEFVRHAEE
jgi:Family of unknown function (DUF5681)